MNTHELIARAVIINKENILLCKGITSNHLFFPGGHVEFTEHIEKALAREIKEECDGDVTKTECMGIVENVWQDGKKQRHELNVLFRTALKSYHVKSIEKELEFHWIPLKKLSKMNIKPVVIPRLIQKWLKNKHIFFVSHIDEHSKKRGKK